MTCEIFSQTVRLRGWGRPSGQWKVYIKAVSHIWTHTPPVLLPAMLPACFHGYVTPMSLTGNLPTPYDASFWTRVKNVERRQWWLWASAIVITLLLTAGMASFSYLFEQSDPNFSFTLRQSVRGLVALVFLFDLYTIYQQILIQRIRRQLSEREELYRLISENAEDLIAVIDAEGHRLYNSPGYMRLFGY